MLGDAARTLDMTEGLHFVVTSNPTRRGPVERPLSISLELPR